MSVHEDTLQGLQEALDYVRGDKTKARSIIVETSNDEIEFYSTYKKLSDSSKHKAMQYVNELLQVSNV